MAGCSCHSHNGFLLGSTGRGEAAQQTSLEGLAPRGELEYLDKVDSVSGPRRDETHMIWNEGVINEQVERFASSSSGEGRF